MYFIQDLLIILKELYILRTRQPKHAFYHPYQVFSIWSMVLLYIFTRNSNFEGNSSLFSFFDLRTSHSIA